MYLDHFQSCHVMNGLLYVSLGVRMASGRSLAMGLRGRSSFGTHYWMGRMGWKCYTRHIYITEIGNTQAAFSANLSLL